MPLFRVSFVSAVAQIHSQSPAKASLRERIDASADFFPAPLLPGSAGTGTLECSRENTKAKLTLYSVYGTLAMLTRVGKNKNKRQPQILTIKPITLSTKPTETQSRFQNCLLSTEVCDSLSRREKDCHLKIT